MPTQDEIHERFKKNLIRSHEAVQFFADWLVWKGVKGVRVPPLRIAPKWQDAGRYGDGGDFFVGKDRFEVKWLTDRNMFTGLADWPHKKAFFITEPHNFDPCDPKPHSIITLNATKTHFGVVYGKDRAKWWPEKVWIEWKERTEVKLTCNPKDVRWGKIHQSFVDWKKAGEPPTLFIFPPGFK